MSRIAEAFKNGKAFIPFITAGDPNQDFTVKAILKMAEAGADCIEIGIPFSDPVAEGVVIQEASLRALEAGMTTDKVFDIVTEVRKSTDVPLCLMGYLNPVFHYGYERFFEKASKAGIDGIIIADMPYEEKNEVSSVADKYGIDVISLIAPTSEDRVMMIAKEAKGYIYLVSSMGVTGVRSKITTDVSSIVEMIKKVTDVPVAIGFGISTPEQAKEMASKADGAIVGSAIMKKIAAEKEGALNTVYEYVKSMADAVHSL